MFTGPVLGQCGQFFFRDGAGGVLKALPQRDGRLFLDPSSLATLLLLLGIQSVECLSDHFIRRTVPRLYNFLLDTIIQVRGQRNRHGQSIPLRRRKVEDKRTKRAGWPQKIPAHEYFLSFLRQFS
jgi:hypothetical protein